MRRSPRMAQSKFFGGLTCASSLLARLSFQLQSEWEGVGGTTKRRSSRNPLSKRTTKPSLHFARFPGRGSPLDRGLIFLYPFAQQGVDLMRHAALSTG